MPEKILIVDDDLDTLKLVGLTLERQGYQISAAANGEQGLAKAFSDDPDAILLDVMMPDMDGLEVTRRLRKSRQTSTTPILLFTAKTEVRDKIAGFEAGADDYLTKPTRPAELKAHLHALLTRSSHNKREESATAQPGTRGQVIGVLAARGGLGVSTLASNLAGAMHSRTHSEVILVELTPGEGSLGMDLGVPNPRGLNELLSGQPAAITRQKVESLLAAHGSGLRLLLASDNPRDVALIGQIRQYEVLVSCLAGLASFVVLDLGSGLPPSVEAILGACSGCVLVIEGSPHGIAQGRMLLDDIAALGIEPAGVSVVLNNRIRSEAPMSWTEVQQNLGHAVRAILTPAPEMLASAARIHTLAVLLDPANSTSQQILKLADQILQREPAT